MSEAAVPRPRAAMPGIGRVLSERRLAERASEGDERAFAEIFRRHGQGIYRYCLTLLRDAQDAQDALQATMEKALAALPGEEREIELKPWLYRIAHNESIDLIRRRRGTTELDPETMVEGPALAAEAETRERLRRLLADVGELPERQRGALVMRELAGLDFDEIGTALGTSAAVARQTLYEARLGLRQFEEGREMRCDEVMLALSDGDGRVARRRDIRAHLRSCPSCRRFREEISQRRHDLAAISPLPAVAAAGILNGLLGGSGASGAGAGLAGAVGGGAAKTIGVGAALKATATVAVVAAVGTVAADRSGLVDTGVPGGAGSVSREAPAGTAPAKGAAAAESAGDEEAGVARRARAQGRESSRGDAHGAGLTGSDASREARKNAGEHGEGHARGREGELPAASANGQETAAEHRNTDRGRSEEAPGQTGETGPPPRPEKPTHPAPPPKPAKPEAAAAPPKPTPAKPEAQPAPPAAEEKAPVGAQAGGKPAAPEPGQTSEGTE